MNLKAAVQALIDRAEGAVEQRHADTIELSELSQFLLLDVREDAEYLTQRIPGAISLPRSRLEMACVNCTPLVELGNRPVLVYCKSGRRSLLAAKALRDLGIENPISMAGGITAWMAADKPVETGGSA